VKRETAKKVLIKNYGRIVEHFAITAPQAQNILLSSAEAKEGKTITAIGLALTTALLKPNKRILLVDLDLRHSMIQRLLKLDKTIGMREVIAGRSSIEEVVDNKVLTNLAVITAGKEAIDFPEALQSSELVDFLENVKLHYDFAFYDSPPVKNYVDVLLLSSVMDGVVMIIRPKISRAEEVVSAKDDIHRANGKVIGSVMNDFYNPIPSFLARLL